MLRRLIALVLVASAPAASRSAEAPFRVDHASPLQAEAKQLDQRDSFTLVRVEFNGIEGDRVPGHLYLPRNPTGRAPAVLVQHGIGDKKQAEYIVQTCRILASRGVIALGIDAPNRGERKDAAGPEKTSLLDPSSVHKWFRQHCGDYSRAFDYLASRDDVDKDRLGYIGFSWGAITGITYSAHDPRVKALASIGGGGNLVGFLGLPPVPGADKKSPPSLDPAHNVGGYVPRPLLFINGRKDTIVFPPFAEALHKAAGATAKVEWYDTDHYFQGVDREKILGGVVDFMKSKLSAKK
ncbi:MAG: dienelactone hydrolase family protein [Verrucomicrobia bacterium]|nr:dienelactone hydrolase family protein [Verrucomicrobiota bacterium]